MAALRADLREAARIGTHYAPRFADEAARLFAAALVVIVVVGAAIGIVS